MSADELNAAEQFDLQQYQLLFARNEEAHKNRFRHLELSLVAIGAFYATIFRSTDTLELKSLFTSILWLPVLIGAIGLWIAMTLRRGMVERGAVMFRIEQDFGRPGWEHEIKKRGTQIVAESVKMIVIPWTMILLATIYIAVAAKLPGA